MKHVVQAEDGKIFETEKECLEYENAYNNPDIKYMAKNFYIHKNEYKDREKIRMKYDIDYGSFCPKCQTDIINMNEKVCTFCGQHFI